MSTTTTDDAPPWYRDGLAFECTRCGHCCTGAPGAVWVTAEEVVRLAAFVGLSPGEFGKRYVRQIGDRLSLVERPNFDCVFWSRDAGCTVYSERPAQCRTWPFWPDHLKSDEAWRAVQRRCPGVGRGRLYSLAEVEDSARSAAEALS